MWLPEAAFPDEGGELARALRWINGRADFFDPAKPILLARAPGRLDLMGGMADYSGSLVLEMPIAEATWVAAQESDERTVSIESEEMPDGRVTFPLEAVAPAEPLDYPRARALLTGDPARAWTAYALGALVVLHRERARPPRQGLRILVRSDVPVGKGVSSSAALEVAALEALAPLVGTAVEDRELALLAQKVENFVVGAPCGVMDQMTSACGRRDHLLEIVCQPAEVVGSLPMPEDLEVFGIDSGIRHAVSGADYATVRAAAFMGYRMITAARGLHARRVSPGLVAIDDPLFHGYLANISPSAWRAEYRAALPERLSGRDFLEGYQGSTDAATTIDPERIYPVRAATEHAVDEHHRVRLFRALLLGRHQPAREARLLLGELMFQSHASYSACGLGSDGTDRLVKYARIGLTAGIYGAKITGGGSGGTVAVLAAKGSRGTVDRVAELYRRQTGRAVAIFAGSSPGSRAYGVRKLLPALN